MKQTRRFFILALLLLLACREAPAPTPTDDDEDNTAVANPDPTNTTEPDPTATETESAPKRETAVPLANPDGADWPPPAKTYDDLSRAPVTAAEQAGYERFFTNLPPERDDVALARAYWGVTDVPDPPPPVTEPLAVGTRQPLTISNIDSNTNSTPEFVLMYVSDHAYFWFDTTPGLSLPGDSSLQAAGDAFDRIYEEDVAIFGSEDNPGVDGDPRIHIVNASPLTVCDVTESTASSCGLGGYFGSSHTLPTSVAPYSNEREMFVMNGSFFGSSAYLDILAHEFRHMIEDNYDQNDWDWEVEGSATLAEDLLGYAADPVARGNVFLSNPDQQLNRWTDGNSLPYYGQGYVINRYIYNRLGPDLYREFAQHPAPGFEAIDAIAAANNLETTGIQLWLDWLAALAIHDHPQAPERYALRDGLDTAASTTINRFPTNLTTTVNQYAADYYELDGAAGVTVDFTGSNHAALLPVQPPSGAHMWLANRGNYSAVRLTRAFDLSDVETATLNYAVFHEIEQGYDFAYVSISDDGQTWQGLVGEHMQGLDFVDNPADSALLPRFYTDRSGGWVQESIDLTPYAGQSVQIRFEYVTDPILTFGGLALDNISIPEIGYYDGAENDNGWTAAGFVRTTGYVPQQWHLQLIRFDGGVPAVEPIPLSEDNTATVNVSLGGAERPILIIAATAPHTLEPAHYELTIQ